ncbi:sigma-54 interaction domain-containing protein [candidate division KSB1 bacterium]
MLNVPETELLKMISNSMGEGLIAVDKDFKIRLFNRSAEKITGYSSKDAIGKFCKYIFKSEHCIKGCPLRITLETNKRLDSFEVAISTKNNQQKTIQVNTAILQNGNNEPVGGIITFSEKEIFSIIRDKIDSLSDFDGMVGRHSNMHQIFELIETIADSDANVLITGESGTGKELLTNSIQKRSRRQGASYIKVNCSVFPETLLASELFGHVKGSFTGALGDRVGRFEMADGGTIFLDEIGEIPQSVQVQLLRVLQDGTFERIGESVTRKADLRVIASTNKVLEDEIKSGSFREDLYYRLNVIPIHVPPLRERKSDIPYLVKFFINKYNIETGKQIEGIEDSAMEMLKMRSWPGNIRQRAQPPGRPSG